MLRRLNSRAKAAISKAQQATGVVVPDLGNRVTALEMEDQAINTDINTIFTDLGNLASADAALSSRADALELYNTQGFSGNVTIIESVNFVAQTVVSKTLTYTNGKLTGVT